MNNVEVEMTIKKNGRWYRFVPDERWCSLCAFYEECNSYGANYEFCPIGKVDVKGHFERFRPPAELVRIAVRLLTRKAKQLYPDANIVCHGPRYPTDAENEIYLSIGRTDPSLELQKLAERLNKLGLII